MAVVYVDSLTGDDGDDGLTPANAKATISGARAALTGGQDLVLVRPGLYLEPNIDWTAGNDANTVVRNDPAYAGVPIIDFEERLDWQAPGSFGHNAYWEVFQPVVFLGLHFRNMNGSARAFRGSNAGWYLIHCVFYSQNGSPTGHAVGSTNFTNNMDVKVLNCTFYNLATAMNCQGNITVIYNCYAPDLTSINADTGGTQDYNAYDGNVEANGIDTTSTDPGFVNAGSLDFRLDPVTVPANYVTFMTSGIDGGRIGAFGKTGVYYDARFPPLRFLAPSPNSAAGNPNLEWENEGPGGTNTYTDGTPGDIIEDPTTFELKIDLGAIPGATGGRVRSDVFDSGAGGGNRLESIALSAFEDVPGGAAVDTNTTLPQELEYRSSNTSFLKGDGTPTWNAFQKGAHLNQAHRYHQIRITLRTDHTNA